MHLNGDQPDMQEVIDYCLDLGLSFTQAGHTDVYPKYTIDGEPGELRGSSEFDIEILGDELNTASKASVELWYDQAPNCVLEIRTNYSSENKISPSISISFNPVPFRTDFDLNPDQHTRPKVQQRVSKIVDLVRNFTISLDPEYVCGYSIGEHDSIIPYSKPVKESISRISWICVISEGLLEQFGGREHVLDTPASDIETLSNGSVLLLLADNPVDPTESFVRQANDHLLHK
jgi:hypothetical protein